MPNNPVNLHTLTLVNGSTLEIHDSIVKADTLEAYGSDLKIYNSYIKVNTFIDPFGSTSTGGSTLLNPSFLEALTIKLIGQNTRMDFALGGPEPAKPDSLGKGHYAHMQADTVELNGKLEIFFVYDFAPQDGQQFTIVTVNDPAGLSGQFVNAPEGSVVTGYCDVALSISYKGGDGNDVVLKAQKTSSPDPSWGCKAQSEEAQPTEKINQDEARPVSSNNTRYFIIGGLVILVVIIAALMRSNKTKSRI
jgi:hypothetical protein